MLCLHFFPLCYPQGFGQVQLNGRPASQRNVGKQGQVGAMHTRLVRVVQGNGAPENQHLGGSTDKRETPNGKAELGRVRGTQPP